MDPILGLPGEDYIIKHDMKLVHKLRNLLGEGGRGGTLKDYV